MFKKKFLLLLSALSLLSVNATTILANPTVSTTTESIISANTETEIREALSELNISDEVQNNLILKLKNGEIWDCMDKSQVAQIPEGYFNVSLDNPVARYTFPDGSVIEHSLDISDSKIDFDGAISTCGIVNGSVSSGSGYMSITGARISTQKGFMGIGFYADFTHVNRGYDYISNVYDPYVKIVGSCSDPVLEITQPRENASGPACAKVSTQASYGVGDYSYTGTEWLKLYVGNDDAWTDEN